MDNEIQEFPQIVSPDMGDKADAPDNVGETPNLVSTVTDQNLPAAKTPPDWKAFPIRSYIIAIAISIILLYTFNNLLNIYVPWIPSDFSKFFWNVLNNVYNHVEIPHLSKAFMQCLWAINIALSFSIIGNFLLLVFRPRWFQYLIRAIIFGLGILAAYVVYVIYPFNFDGATINNIIKAVLIVGMALLFVALIIACVRCIIALMRERRHLEILVDSEISSINPGSPDKPIF
jgi:hypothetical protein